MSMLVSIAFSGCGSGSPGTSSPSTGPAPAPPVAEAKPRVVTIHGRTWTDEYFWLREKTNPKVMEYLKAEDAYAQAMMTPTAALQDSL